jgi:hypothetical protein
MQHLALVLVPRAGGPVPVQDQRPSLPVDGHLVVERAQQYAVCETGVAAVGFVFLVVPLAGGGGLVAPARLLP